MRLMRHDAKHTDLSAFSDATEFPISTKQNGRSVPFNSNMTIWINSKRQWSMCSYLSCDSFFPKLKDFTLYFFELRGGTCTQERDALSPLAQDADGASAKIDYCFAMEPEKLTKAEMISEPNRSKFLRLHSGFTSQIQWSSFRNRSARRQESFVTNCNLL